MAVFGDTLRQARAYKGVTLKEAEQATRINRHHLAALEDENFGVLPPLIYQRGIVRNYAAYLDLDPGKLLSMFDEARGGESTAELVAAVKPLDMPSHWAPNFAIIAFLVVMSAIVFAWVYSASFAQNGAPATASSLPLPTVTPTGNLELADLPSPTAQPSSAAVPQEAGAAAIAPQPTARVVNPAQTLPTSTPSPTPRAVNPVRPTATATPTPTEISMPTVPPTPEPPLPVAEVQPELSEPPVVENSQPQVPESEMDTIRVIADGDIYVTVADGNGAVLFAGSLSAGSATDYFTAQSFLVTTSNGSLTRFENPNLGGEPFFMGYGENETYPLG